MQAERRAFPIGHDKIVHFWHLTCINIFSLKLITVLPVVSRQLKNAWMLPYTQLFPFPVEIAGMYLEPSLSSLDSLKVFG